MRLLNHALVTIYKDAKAHKTRFLKRVLVFVLAGSCAIILGNMIVINITDSIPGRVFVKNPLSEVVLGSTVVFPFKHEVFPAGVEHMTKIVRCQEGQMLEKHGPHYFCDNELIAIAKKKSKTGESLRHFEWKIGKIPEGKFFAASHHIHGFDSRYFGLIPVQNATVIERIF